MLFVFSLIVVFALVFTGLGFESVNAENYEITLVAHNIAIDFWIPMEQGAMDAGEHLGIDVSWTGPYSEDHAEQVSIIEDLIVAGVDGIGTTLADPDAYDDIVQEALDEGIPVIGFDADAPDNPRLAHIGLDDYAAGQLWGEEIVEYLGEEAKIAIGIEYLGHSGLEARREGAEDYLEQYDYEIDVVEVSGDYPTAVETFQDYFLANPDVEGLFGTGAVATPAAMELTRLEGVEDEIVTGGFDLVEDTMTAIAEGYGDFTIDQFPYVQGYYTVLGLYLYNELGIHPVDIAIDGGIIDATNVDEARELAAEGYR